MFTGYLTSFDDILCDAKKSKHVIHDTYISIHATISKYVIDNNLILSNVDILVKTLKKSNTYIIYGDNIFKHANDLANAISKITIYVYLYTNVKNEDFSISVNGTRLIQLFNIPKRLYGAVVPIKINNILIYPPEFELIGLYNKLYNPAYYDEWEKLNEIELEVRKYMYTRKKILGGYHSNKKQKKQKKPKESYINTTIIFDWLRNRHDYILVGIHAIFIIKGLHTTCQKVQIITDSPIEKITSDIQHTILKHTGFNITHTTHNANISTDPRLKKTVISVTIPTGVQRGTRTIHLIDIFNSGQYELIPYTVYKDLNIGHTNVLRMFMLIDMWFIRILFTLNVVKGHILKRAIDSIFENFKKIDSIEPSKYSEEIYLGTHVDLIRYKQKQGTYNIFYPYIPEQHRYQKNEFRKV